jgi:hypothetical protein
MMTVYSIPKAFKGHIDVIQRNAIATWTRLQPRPEIILFGPDEGTAEAAREFGVEHESDVARNKFGSPLFGDVFRKAETRSSNDLLCFVNADIILTSKLMGAIQRVCDRFPRFLAVSERINLNITRPIDFSSDWEAELQEGCRREGTAGGPTCIDIFVFKKGTYSQVPDFAIGRLWFDHWLIKAASLANLPIVDMSRVAPLIHQNHDYNHVPGGAEWVWKGEEAEINFKLYGGGRQSYTLSNVTHELLSDGGIRRVRFRKEWLAAKNFVWEMAVHRTHSLRSRLGLTRTPARNA